MCRVVIFASGLLRPNVVWFGEPLPRSRIGSSRRSGARLRSSSFRSGLLAKFNRPHHLPTERTITMQLSSSEHGTNALSHRRPISSCKGNPERSCRRWSTLSGIKPSSKNLRSRFISRLSLRLRYGMGWSSAPISLSVLISACPNSSFLLPGVPAARLISIVCTCSSAFSAIRKVSSSNLRMNAYTFPYDKHAQMCPSEELYA